MIKVKMSMGGNRDICPNIYSVDVYDNTYLAVKNVIFEHTEKLINKDGRLPLLFLIESDSNPYEWKVVSEHRGGEVLVDSNSTLEELSEKLTGYSMIVEFEDMDEIDVGDEVILELNDEQILDLQKGYDILGLDLKDFISLVNKTYTIVSVSAQGNLTVKETYYQLPKECVKKVS